MEMISMMTVISKNNWQSQLTKGKEYKVYYIHNQYYLIVDDIGRLCYEYSRLFTEPVGEIEKKYTNKFAVNWNIL